MVFDNFYNAWHFLENHPIFKEKFQVCLCIEVVKVDPTTERIEDDENKNTATHTWLECGPWLNQEELNEIIRPHFPDGMPCHDYELDCGAETFEKGIIELANLVFKKYGKYDCC